VFRRIGRTLVLAGAIPMLLLGTGPVGANTRGFEGVPSFDHVYLIIGENTELGQINKQDAPYIMGTLKPESAWLTQYFALTHFSEANYVGMTSGQFTACQQFDGSAASCHQAIDNLFAQLDVAGVTWQSWMESMPDACWLVSTGSAKDRNHYGAKHNPAIFYDGIESSTGVWTADRTLLSTECLQNDIPAGGTGPNDMSAFNGALQAGTTAQFNLVVPNECEDAHDNCKPTGNPMGQFDTFLSNEIPLIQTYDPDALVIVTFDEGTSNRGLGHGHQFAGGGNVAWFALGPLVQAGSSSDTNYDHYSLLRTLEDGYGISDYLYNAADAIPITGIWN
jgi:phosphatidylinositol-3-phosphatase